MGDIAGPIVAIIGGVLTLAIISVILSKNANTPAVFQAGGSALGSVIGAAVQPVSGTGANQFASGGIFAGQ